MDLPNRSKLEVETRRAVQRVFTQYKEPSSRMPAWGSFKADLIEQVLPVIRKIQLAAIRNMFAAYGDGPAPPEAKPEALERAEQLANDLASVSIKRWKELGRRKTEQDIADWYATNFGKKRSSLIGVTETTFAHEAGETIALRWLRKQKVQLEEIWVTEKNPCPKCAKMNGKKKRYWSRY